MNKPPYLGLIAAAGLSALATGYALRSADMPLTPAAQNTALLEKFDRLQESIDSLNNGFKSIDASLNRLASATPVISQAADAATGAPGEAPPEAHATPAPGASAASPRSKMIIVNPTPEQSAYFETMKQRLNDPSYVKSMSLAELDNNDLKALPPAMRQAILLLAVQKFNNGEVDKETFLPKTAGVDSLPNSSN